MKLTRLSAACALALAITPLSACSDDRAKDALTVSEDDRGSNADDGQEEAEEADDEFERAGRTLTRAEISAALPTIKDLPTGWSRDSESEEDDDEEEDETITPKRCEDLFGENADAEADVEESRAFKADEWGPFLSVEIGTYDEAVPSAALEKVAQAMSKCKRFTSVDADGAKSKVRAEALSFPNLGEETFAVRLDMDTEFLPVAMDLVMVRVGHNMVLLYTASLGGRTNTQLLEKIGRATVERLNS